MTASLNKAIIPKDNFHNNNNNNNNNNKIISRE